MKSNDKFEKGFNQWLKDNKYSFILQDWCPHCVKFKEKFKYPNSIPINKTHKGSIGIPATFHKNKHRKVDSNKEIIIDLYKKYQKTQKKSGFGYNYLQPKNWKTSLTKTSGTYRPKGSRDYIPQPGKWGSFSATAGLNRAGNAIPCQDSANWIYKNRAPPRFPLEKMSSTSPSQRSMKRSSASSSSIPLLMYGKSKRKSSRKSKRKSSRKSKYGELLSTVAERKYNKRGINGFDQVPKSIYMYEGGPVANYSYSPYTGARMSGILPRPYGNRDNAAIKGYSNSPYLKGNVNVDKYYNKYPNHFGSSPSFGPFMNQAYTTESTAASNELYPSEFGSSFGPFMNQAYTTESTAAANEPFDDLNYGPFINQAYNFGRNKKKKTKKKKDGRKMKKCKKCGCSVNCKCKNCNFGYSPNLTKMQGYRNAKPLFRPHYLRNWNPGYNSYANQGLYEPTWNPYQGRIGRTAEQKEIARGSRLARAQDALQANTMGLAKASYGRSKRKRGRPRKTKQKFGGQLDTYGMMGPNSVAYENPMLMYSGPGANTVNYLTGRNYLASCDSNDQYPYLKVQRNNNPTGFLSGSNVVPLSGVRSHFGRELSKVKEGILKEFYNYNNNLDEEIKEHI